MLRKTKVMLASGAAAVVVAGAGIGVAEAASNTAPAAPPSSSKTAHPGKRHPGLLARTLHGQLTLAGKKHRTVDVQRGKVQAVTPTSITVQSSDSFTASYTVNTSTKVRKNKQQSNISQVAVGDRVVVVADAGTSPATADRIADNGPAPAGS